jgi:hypothetical protein
MMMTAMMVVAALCSRRSNRCRCHRGRGNSADDHIPHLELLVVVSSVICNVRPRSEFRYKINNLMNGSSEFLARYRRGYDPTTLASQAFARADSRGMGRELENFIRAQLRKKSGATITPEELDWR